MSLRRARDDVPVRIEEYGDRAVLVGFDDEAEVGPWAEALERDRPALVLDVVRGAASVVVVGTEGAANETLRQLAESVVPLDAEGAGGEVEELLEVPVRYDGEDVDEVARATELSVADVGALHSSVEYQVAFCGFAPGFGYLTGLPEGLHLPRRATPRPRVPTGALAIADRYSGVYPTASPGGWWLIGTANVPIFDIDRDPPALFTPGRRVRFVPS